MTITEEHTLRRYLLDEAERVTVQDQLELVGEMTTVVVPHPHSARRPVSPMQVFVSAAAAVAVLVGLGALQHSSPTPLAPQAASPTALRGSDAAPGSTAAPTTVAPPPVVALPDGATFQGLVPECTTDDQLTFHCTIDAFPPDQRTSDMTGYVNGIVDGTSHVSGGCRVQNAEGTQLVCYIGQLAVEQQIVGAGLLGQYSPRITYG